MTKNLIHPTAIVEKGDRVEVNETLCVGCRLCTKVCNFDAFEKAGDNDGKA